MEVMSSEKLRSNRRLSRPSRIGMRSVSIILNRLSHESALILLREHGLLRQSMDCPRHGGHVDRRSGALPKELEVDSGIDSSPETSLRGRRRAADTARSVGSDGSEVRERKVFLHQTCHEKSPDPVVNISPVKLIL